MCNRTGFKNSESKAFEICFYKLTADFAVSFLFTRIQRAKRQSTCLMNLGGARSPVELLFHAAVKGKFS